MAMRCLKCWSKTDDPILLADGFNGCFCHNCYRQNREKIDEFMEIFSSFLYSESEEEAAGIMNEIESSAEKLFLHDEGVDLLFSYMTQKASMIESEIDMIESENDEKIHQEHLEEEAARKDERIREYEKHKHQLRRDFIITTGNNVEGYRITAYRGIAKGISVLGTQTWFSIRSYRDDKGGNRELTETMDRVTDNAVARAIDDAIKLGANALIATDIDYSIDESMIAAVVNGTAVSIEKKEKD